MTSAPRLKRLMPERGALSSARTTALVEHFCGTIPDINFHKFKELIESGRPQTSLFPVPRKAFPDNGNDCYHRSVRRKITIQQIRAVCEEMLQQTDAPSVRSVMAQLRLRHGACGRTERVAEVLRGLIEKREARRQVPESSDVVSLRQQLFEAEQRAVRAEELERRHQDFWAERYQEKIEELQSRVGTPISAGVSSEQYLRLYRQAAELARRLAQYEQMGSVLELG